jgi:hypothetical protein
MFDELTVAKSEFVIFLYFANIFLGVGYTIWLCGCVAQDGEFETDVDRPSYIQPNSKILVDSPRS